MQNVVSYSRPDWVSDTMFPFESRFFETPSGHRMHYVDEGDGEPIVFLHGNPSWSFEFRHLIGALRSEYRCVAPDHVGFGLSGRSQDNQDYRPDAHARAFESLMEVLDLRDVTLFMSDWGGPIGLDFARRHPDRVKRIVIANTWCWPVNDDMHFRRFSFMMRSWVGQLLIKGFNCFVNKVVPKAVGDSSILTPEVMDHYRNAQPNWAARAAFPGHIIGSSEWLGSIWDKRDAFTEKPALLLWGLKDIAFRVKELERWKSALSNYEVREFDDCGHFLAEEAPERVIPDLRDFIART